MPKNHYTIHPKYISVLLSISIHVNLNDICYLLFELRECVNLFHKVDQRYQKRKRIIKFLWCLSTGDKTYKSHTIHQPKIFRYQVIHLSWYNQLKFCLHPNQNDSEWNISLLSYRFFPLALSTWKRYSHCVWPLYIHPRHKQHTHARK